MFVFDGWSRSDVLSLIQTFALVITTGGAIYIGLKQNAINNKLYELQTAISVNFEVNKDSVFIKNVGNTNIKVLAARFGKNHSSRNDFSPNGWVVTPESVQRIFRYSWKEYFAEYIKPNGKFAFEFLVILADVNHQVYSVKVVAEVNLNENSEADEIKTIIVDFKKTGPKALSDDIGEEGAQLILGWNLQDYK